MRNESFRIGLVCVVIVLFIGMGFMPIAGSRLMEKQVLMEIQVWKPNSCDDNETTSFATTISFNPLYLNSNNSWQDSHCLGDIENEYASTTTITKNEDKTIQAFFIKEELPDNWKATEIVSTESTDHSYVSSLMVDGDGTLHVAWHDHTDYGGSGSDSDIFYKYKTSDGSWSVTEVVSTESTSSSEQPSLRVDSDGTVHVSWMDETNYGGSGYDYDIFYKFKPDGGSWSVTEVVSTESTSFSWYPSLMVDSDGTVHVTWEDWTNYGGSGSDSDIFYKFKPDGGSWSVTEVVSTESTSFSEQPSLMVDSDGKLHVAWDDGTDYGGCGSDYDIFYKFKPDGGSWSVTEVVSIESTDISGRPSLMVDGDGMVHVTWEDLTDYSGSGSDRDIFYKFKPDGGSWSVTEVVSTESTSFSWSPSLIVDSDGKLHVAWDDGTNYGGSGNDDDIFYKFKPDGGSWSVTEVVSTESTDTSWWPSLMVDGNGRVHVTWHDWTDYGGSGSDRDIFYKYRTPSLRANAHGPYYGKSGESLSLTGSATGGTPPYSWLWDFGDGNTSDEQNPTHVYFTPGNFTLTLTVTDDNDNSCDDITWAYIENNPPNSPDIDGPTKLKPGEEGTFTVSSVDPAGDQIFFNIDWGDGNIVDWDGPYNSGQDITYKHTWSTRDTYIIKVKAKDTYDAESECSELEVSIPRSRIKFNNPFWILSSYFVNFFTLLIILQQLGQ